MILHRGERVYWGAPEVIYLEGSITSLDEALQRVVVQVDRASPNAAHLIGEEVAFAANGLASLQGDSPAGTTGKRGAPEKPSRMMSDDEKLRGAAAVAVHQKYGTTITNEQREAMIEQVRQALESDSEMRARILDSMDQILRREKGQT